MKFLFNAALFISAFFYSMPAAGDTIQSAETKFDTFLKALPSTHPDSLQSAVCHLLADADPDSYRRIYSLASETFFKAGSPYRDEDCYRWFLQDAVSSDNLSETDRARARYRLEMIMKNRPGSKAPDFAFLDRQGVNRRLYDFCGDSELLLLFYDPDCDHCSDTIEKLRAIDNPGWTILAIDTEEDLDLWKRSVTSLPDNWIAGFSTDPIQEEDTYIFQEMPSIYLLNRDGTIILKDTTVENACKTVRQR